MPSNLRSSAHAAGEPIPLGDALSQLFAARGYGRPQTDRQLRDVWHQVAGAEIAGQTRVSGIKGGILLVGVANSALLGELASFGKSDILHRLQSKHPDLRVRDIKFRLQSQIGRSPAAES